MEPMNAVSGASGGMQTIYCSYCSVQLSFPRGSMYIQCPRCQATQNPHAPQQTVCIGCGTLLAHPANSLYIQCPKCMITQNARENRANLNQNGNTGGLLHDGNSLPIKTPKKKKDPNAPKAASNAYMIFCKERRAELKSENPELAFGKIGAKLGEIWRTLSSEEKRPYEERASADRERYRKQMESYKADGDGPNDDGDHDVPSALSNKRSNDSLDDGGLRSLETDLESHSKRLKVDQESNNQGHDLSNEYHDVGLYGHGFGDHHVDHPHGQVHSNNNLSGFGDHVSAPIPTHTHDHINNENCGHDLLDVGSGIHDTDALGDHSDGLVLNVHHGLGGSESEADLPNSPADA